MLSKALQQLVWMRRLISQSSDTKTPRLTTLPEASNSCRMPPMSAPKKPSDRKNPEGQVVPTKRSVKSKLTDPSTSDQQAPSSEMSSSVPPKSTPNAKSKGRSPAKKPSTPLPSAPEADTLPLEILDVLEAPIAAQIPTRPLQDAAATISVASPTEPKAAAPIAELVQPRLESIRIANAEPDDNRAAENPIAEIKSPPSIRAKDSQPPVPSSLLLHQLHEDGDTDKLSPPTSRPRMSVRPANYLTSYDLPLDRESLKLGVANHIEYTQGKDEFSATQLDYFMAAAYATRDRLFDRWNKTQQTYYRRDHRRVYYLSMEFLLGRLFEDSLLNLGIRDAMNASLSDLGLDSTELAEAEYDAGLGNGGLGRLAACLLDSMATVGLPGMGYGIRYEFGIFEQQIINGRQVERADNWLRYGNPWEVARPEQRYLVRYGGRVVEQLDHVGRNTFNWVDTDDVWAMAYDILVPGYGNDVVNTLRLWSARATRGFQFSYFNDGDYIKAVEAKNATENISRVLYPTTWWLKGANCGSSKNSSSSRPLCRTQFNGISKRTPPSRHCRRKPCFSSMIRTQPWRFSS